MTTQTASGAVDHLKAAARIYINKAYDSDTGIQASEWLDALTKALLALQMIEDGGVDAPPVSID